MQQTHHAEPPAHRFELYQQIGEALAAQAPEGWAKIVVEVRMHQNHMFVEARWFDDDLCAAPQLIDMPAEVSIWFGEMREVMPLEGRALWHAARFTLLANGHFDCSFDYEQEAAKRPMFPQAPQVTPIGLDEVDALMLDLASSNVPVLPTSQALH
jgi:hypothetical protein